MTKLTVEQTAELLNVSKQRVRELCNKQTFQAEKFSDVWMIDKQSVLDYKSQRDERAQGGKS